MQETEKILMILKLAVMEELDKKRRLEQYAVIWSNNRVVFIENNDKKLTVMKNDRRYAP